ncbi:uncharacterized protein LOC123661823 [Melitaea cinxia]|uniref:uncharacterized protein LOC123661823 n=1 Tax=Melitaea cinxia TaxID=113334 RepID=UPI001E273536|nr:uncharacterized protein LOC123661823 [Melitaea cinxia]
MKFFIAFAALIAVSAAASFHKPSSNFDAEFQAIMDAINSPSTDPATAILLQEQLQSILGIDVEPVIIPDPVLVDEPQEVPQEVPQEAAPVSSPLVKITINVNTESAPAPAPGNVRPEPVPVDFETIETNPVIIDPVIVDPVIVAPIDPEAVLLPGIHN